MQMLPVAVVIGALVGRWWALPVAATAWVVLLRVDAPCGWDCAFGGAALAALNAAGGVAIHRMFRIGACRFRKRSSPTTGDG